jgi:hypothetical protein
MRNAGRRGRTLAPSGVRRGGRNPGLPVKKRASPGRGGRYFPPARPCARLPKPFCRPFGAWSVFRMLTPGSRCASLRVHPGLLFGRACQRSSCSFPLLLCFHNSPSESTRKASDIRRPRRRAPCCPPPRACPEFLQRDASATNKGQARYRFLACSLLLAACCFLMRGPGCH